MESVETPPLETFVVRLPVELEASGPGGLNTGLAEEDVVGDEQGGEDCAEEWDEANKRLWGGTPEGETCGGRPGGVR